MGPAPLEPVFAFSVRSPSGTLLYGRRKRRPEAMLAIVETIAVLGVFREVVDVEGTQRFSHVAFAGVNEIRDE